MLRSAVMIRPELRRALFADTATLRKSKRRSGTASWMRHFSSAVATDTLPPSARNDDDEAKKDDEKHQQTQIAAPSLLSFVSAAETPQASIVSRDNSSLWRLMELSRSEWPLIAMSAATLGVTSSVTLLLPFASGQVIDMVSATGVDQGGTSPVLLASGLFGLSALAGGGVYFRTIWLARAGNRIVARLKQQMYASLLHQDLAFLDQQRTGDLLSRLTADAQQVQSALTTQAVAGLRGVIMSVGAAGMLLWTSPTLALISCGTLPPIFIISRHIGRSLQQQQEYVQKLQGDATSLAEQSLASISTVKQFNGEAFETVQYQQAIAKAHTTAVETAHLQAQLEAGAHIVGNAAILGVLGYGGTMVLDGSISAGDLTGFVMYSLLLAGNLSGLTSVYSDLVRAVAASNRVFDILDRTPAIGAPPHEEQIQEPLLDSMSDPLIPVAEEEAFVPRIESEDPLVVEPVSIELNGVNFSYPTRPDVQVLNNLHLSVEPGEVVAIVGSSGSGKSTLANLLTRLYDPDDDLSTILINGKRVSDYDPIELRQMIAVVSQEPTLFRGSIRDNIRYGQWASVSDEQVYEAAKLAHVLDFAESFPDGLDTMVGPRGTQLSGGQRQRIALARALAKNAPLTILDEATSALDAQSEHLVQKAMNSMMTKSSGKTILSIAHRLSTIRHASRVVVMSQGAVVQMGTFDELALQEGPFRELMKTQLVAGG